MRLFFFKRKSRILESEARDYLAALLRRQSGSDAPYTLERLTHATNPNIYKVQRPDEPGMLLRFHRLGKEPSPDAYFRANDFMRSKGFRAPEIVYKDRSPETRRRYGAEVSLERFIEGDLFQGAHLEDDAVIRAIAALMHRMHSITRETPGLPWQVDPRSYFEMLLARIKHFLEKALKTGLMTRGEAKACLRWFEPWRPVIDSIRVYNLVHGDFNWRNVIIPPSGELAVLDFVSLHFGLFELDLAESTRSLLADSPRVQEVFMQEYFRLAGEDWRERYKQNFPFFSAYVNLEKATSNAMKAFKVARGEKNDAQPYREKSERFLAGLREIINQG